jgi:hypothetical protein
MTSALVPSGETTSHDWRRLSMRTDFDKREGGFVTYRAVPRRLLRDTPLHETYLSAKRAQTQAQTRIPGSDANPGRPCDHQASS